MRRGQQWIGGFALILLGALLLADQMGLRLPNGSSFTGLFWPFALINFGAWFLLGAILRKSSALEWQEASAELQGASSAKLHINHGAGELSIAGGSAANELFRGRFKGGVRQNVKLDGNQIEVRLRPEEGSFDLPMSREYDQREWNLSLNQNIPIALKLDLGANKSTVDLGGLQIKDLKVNAGACDLLMTMPAKGRLKADFDIGAASCRLIIPEGVSARIHGTMIAGDMKVNSARFPRSNGMYESPDFASAENAVEIHVNGGAASVSIQ